MCGIAGYISNSAKPLPQAEILARVKAMQTALLHRGPDHQGLFESAAGKAVLCHTRLSIIDPSADAHQPMVSEDGQHCLSFNGEIYNYKKLRHQLIEQGESFRTNSDTEVVLKLLIRNGSSALSLLRGMFAIAFWDERRQRILLARDPLGIKPVYYCNKDNSLAFASELRALLKANLSSRKLSSRGLQHYFLRGSFSEPDTAFTDIKLLPAGTFFQWRYSKPRLKAYWLPKFAPHSMSAQRATEITRTALEHSVRAHLVSDVPVGLFLSGGIDSTTLLAFASQISKTPINTYSIAVNDPRWNEGDIAKRTAEHFGANHTEWVLDAKQARGVFVEFLSAIDQPSNDGFNSFCAAKLAHLHGEKVVLSGLGADELFAGYPSFNQLQTLQQKALKYRRAARFVRPIWPWLARYASPKHQRAVDMLMRADHLPTIFQSFRGIFSQVEAQILAQKLSGKSSQAKHTKLRAENQADRISELELTQYCRNQLLRDADVFSMHFGLELRVPFIDKVLVEQLLTIPTELRLQSDKRLLVDSVPKLPQWVLDQPKRGFRFPFDQWMKPDLLELPTKCVPPWIKLDPWYRRWSVSVLTDWLTHYQQN